MRSWVLLVIVAVTTCGCTRDVPEFVARPGAKPTCTFELRKAEPTLKEGLIERTLKGTRTTYYLYPEIELSNADLAGTAVRITNNPKDGPTGPYVQLFLTEAGTQKLDNLTKGYDYRDSVLKFSDTPPPLYFAFLVDDELVIAARVRAHLTEGIIPLPVSASQAEAEKLAKALVGE